MTLVLLLSVAAAHVPTVDKIMLNAARFHPMPVCVVCPSLSYMITAAFCSRRRRGR